MPQLVAYSVDGSARVGHDHGVGDGEVDVEAFVAAAAYMAGVEVAERKAFDVDLHCAGHVADNSCEEFAPGCQVHVFDLFFEARGA